MKDVPKHLYLVPLLLSVVSVFLFAKNKYFFFTGVVLNYATIMLWTVYILARYGTDDWRR